MAPTQSRQYADMRPSGGEIPTSYLTNGIGASNAGPPGSEMQQRPLRDYLGNAEVGVYNVLAVMLAITAFATLVGAGHLLWNSLAHWTIGTDVLRVLDQLLIVLMLVEVLHTVRISIRSHILLAGEPFLVVRPIASIRRILIISLQMTSLTREAKWSADGASIFHGAMIELGLLVVLVFILVFCITLLRRYAPAPKELRESTG